MYSTVRNMTSISITFLLADNEDMQTLMENIFKLTYLLYACFETFLTRMTKPNSNAIFLLLFSSQFMYLAQVLLLPDIMCK